jgi:hypothetical protein
MRPTTVCRLLIASTLIAVLAATLPTVLPPAAGQEKETTSKGQVKIGLHKQKMEAGKLYQVKVDAEGFSPTVSLRPGYFVNSETINMGDTFQGFVLPTTTADHRITVLPSLYDDLDDKTFDYKITVTPIPLAEKPILDEKFKLAATDAVYMNEGVGNEKYPHKAFTIQMKARQIYIITLKGAAKELDPMLFLEGPGGKIVARDDDGGGNMNARIFIQPRRGGEHKIIATTTTKDFGEFAVTVQTTDKGEK